MSKKLLLIVGIIVIFALFFMWHRGEPKDTGVLADDYKSATYEINGEQVKLENGFAMENSLTTRYFGNNAKGDLNNDGVPDLAFILTQDGGGSGRFYYIVVALQINEQYRGTNAILLGDRISAQTTEIRDGKLIVNYADRNPGEPMTTDPSLGVSKYLKISGIKLVEIKP